MTNYLWRFFFFYKFTFSAEQVTSRRTFSARGGCDRTLRTPLPTRLVMSFAGDELACSEEAQRVTVRIYTLHEEPLVLSKKSPLREKSSAPRRKKGNKRDVRKNRGEVTQAEGASLIYLSSETSNRRERFTPVYSFNDHFTTKLTSRLKEGRALWKCVCVWGGGGVKTFYNYQSRALRLHIDLFSMVLANISKVADNFKVTAGEAQLNRV